MIIPMYKYSFLVHHSAYKDFLEDIRNIGVVHINEKIKEPTLEMQDLYRHLSEVDKAAKKLKMLEPKKIETLPELSTGEELFDRLKEIERELEHNFHTILQHEKEQKQLKPWGDFRWELVEKLKQNGITTRFLLCPVKKFKPEWEENYYIKVIGDHEGYRYFVRLDKNGNLSDTDTEINRLEELSGADEVVLPHLSLSQAEAEISAVKAKIDALKDELNHIASYGQDLLKSYIEDIQRQIAEQNAILQTSDEVEGKVKILEGWVPETKKAPLDEYLENNQILYSSDKPEDEDKVPVLLHNNRFARLYEIIGNLYDLPNHKEIDLVPFFAPFYMMFFGFCLGDAGYGLFIILAAALAKRKLPSMKSVFSLAQWLGLATVIFGILTGTFFGIDLINADIPWLSKAKEFMVDTDQLFNLALILGVVQILFGMVIKVFNVKRTQGVLYTLPTIGWLILLIGLAVVFGLKSAGALSDQVAGTAQYAVMIVAGLLILVLNNPKRNILINIGAGLWDVYVMATGLLGDLLSYIRLFALGISSAILGMVFNSMAMSMKPDNIIFGPLVMIIILVIGHGITIFMSSLGAFVHPIRLTFVEFYKNAGFTGGGKAYKPFAEPASKS
jgi:V/A-type H+-transporting ATPase subunit I